MADSTLNRFVSAGTAAARGAYTPSPPTPSSGPTPGYFWYETDTGDTYSWKAGTGWVKVNNSSGSVTTTGSPASGNLSKFSGSGTITNGDLSGDVTTSGTLAATIANDAVTYAKMQNASATSRILARKTAGSGDFEECTVAEVLNFIASSAQGDVMIRDGSGWTRLAAGTSGQFLQTQGAAANPQWATSSSAAWALAGTGQTATGVYDQAVDGSKANIDFAGLGSYNELLIVARGLTDATTGTRILRASVDNGSTFFSSSGDYVLLDNAGVEANSSAWGGHDTNSTGARSFVTHVVNLKGAAKVALINRTTGFIQNMFVGSASDVNAIRVTNSGGGNITGGTVRVYAR